MRTRAASPTSSISVLQSWCEIDVERCVGCEVCVHIPTKKSDLLHALLTMPAALPGRYMVMAEQGMAGRCLEFLKDNILFPESAPGADVYALEQSEFHVTDAAHLLADPAALLYITMILARRLDAANHGLHALKSQLEAGEPAGLVEQTIDRIEGFLSAIGSGYLRAGAGYSGYPFA